eukprot:jgi/Ulvmu1/5050/UM021_0067.1
MSHALDVRDLTAQTRALQAFTCPSYKSRTEMSKGVNIIIPCTVVDQSELWFGGKDLPCDLCEKTTAALSAPAFVRIFGEEASENLAVALLRAIEAGHSRPPLGSAPLESADNRRNLGPVSASNHTLDNSTSADPQPQGIKDQENLQYFFILARGTRRVISARELSAQGRVCPPAQRPRPCSNRHSRHDQAPRAQQRAHSARRACSAVTAAVRPRPASAACCPETSENVTTPAQPARPRSASLLQDMSAQINGPISVSQVMRGDLISSSIHNEVEQAWGVPPRPISTESIPPQSAAISVKIEAPGARGETVLEVPGVWIPEARVPVMGAKERFESNPKPSKHCGHATHRPHTAPSSSRGQRVESQQAPATRQHGHGIWAGQGGHCGSDTTQKQAGDEVQPTAKQPCRASERVVYDASQRQTWQQQTRASTAVTRQPISRPFSCRPRSGRWSCSGGSSSGGSLRPPSAHMTASGTATMTRSLNRALCSYNAHPEAAPQHQPATVKQLAHDAPVQGWDGDPHPPGNCDVSGAHQDRHVVQETGEAATSEGIQDWEPSAASLAITSAACTSAHTFHLPADLLTEATHTTVNSLAAHSAQYTDTQDWRPPAPSGSAAEALRDCCMHI